MIRLYLAGVQIAPYLASFLGWGRRRVVQTCPRTLAGTTRSLNIERGFMSGQLTKRALEESLKHLLLTKPLTKIMIADLTEDCGVSRMTFYYPLPGYI